MTSCNLNTLSKIATRLSTVSSPIQLSKRWVHGARPEQAIMMPAMSPLMTVGTIRRWRKREGESFSPGDVLLQIESDIAMVDVQAENAGIITKILIPDGTTNVPVEKILALVAKDSQEYTQLKLKAPPSPLQFTAPSSPLRRSPSPFEQSARSPSTRRSSFRYQVHVSNSTPTSSINNSPSAGAVRGMVTNHVQIAETNRRMSVSGSQPVRRSETTFANGSFGAPQEDKRESQLDGPSLRRIIVSNLARSSPAVSASKSKTAEYFEGIL